MARGVGALILLVTLTGCELGNSGGLVDQGAIDTALDDSLVVLVTRNGQRGLVNLMLPDVLADVPSEPSNPLTPEKVELGRLLFHEPALATTAKRAEGMGTYSCATCHHAGAGFQAGRRQSVADGGSGWGVNGEGRRAHAAYPIPDVDAPTLRSPSILNVGYQQVMQWAGEMGANGPNVGTEANWSPDTFSEINQLGHDGVESQAIAALTKHRMADVAGSIVATHPTYQALWQSVFPGEPVTIELVGLAIAAYERTVVANRAPFQRWLRGETEMLSTAEKRGAIIFFGTARCERCHGGPAFSSMAFYALGMPDMRGSDVIGPVPLATGRGGFNGDPEEVLKFKVPQLYNMKDSPFYGHGGTFRTIREVVDYYDVGLPEVALPPGRLTDRFHPLELSEQDLADLTLFLTESLRDPDLDRYVPDSVPSGGCIPANDAQARVDLGC